MTEQNLPDPDLNVQGEDPVIPDEGVDAVPPELVEGGIDTEEEGTVDETVSDELDSYDRSGADKGAPLSEFDPGNSEQ
ncbi:MAG TPA: hypothetical protein VHH13_02535 [Arthrobacter sp.]|jgi:hypothetical protein|nr:hypothetical protein [Arthrobacter sp.]